MQLTKNELNRLKEKLAEVFADFPVEFAYLFGSQIKEKAGKLSDVDVAVFLSPKSSIADTISGFLEFQSFIKKAVNCEQIDLVILNDAAPVLKAEAVLKGERIYAKNLKRTLAFEKAVLDENEDMGYFYKVCSQNMAARIRQGRFGEKLR
jgi:predicted nucleotidyltransferase